MYNKQDLYKLPKYYMEQLLDMGQTAKESFSIDSECLEFNPNPENSDGWINLQYADDETWAYIAYIAQICKPQEVEDLEKQLNSSNLENLNDCGTI